MGFGSYSTGGFKKLGWGIQLVTVTEVSCKPSSKGNGLNLSVNLSNEEGASERYVSLGWLPFLIEPRELDGKNDAKLIASRMELFNKAKATFEELNAESSAINKLESDSEKEAARAKLQAKRIAAKNDNKFIGLVDSLVKFEKFCTGFGKDAISFINSYTFDGDVEKLVKAYLSAINNKQAYVFLATSETESKGKVYTNVTLSPNLNMSESWATYAVESVEDIFGEDAGGDPFKTGCKVTFKSGKSKSIMMNAKNVLKLDNATPNDVANDLDDDSGVSDTGTSDDLPF